MRCFKSLRLELKALFSNYVKRGRIAILHIRGVDLRDFIKATDLNSNWQQMKEK